MYRAVIHLARENRTRDSKQQIITSSSVVRSDADRFVQDIIASLKGPLVATGYHTEVKVEGVGWVVDEDESPDTE